MPGYLKAFIYYGMCGAFKYTTIINKHPEGYHIFSEVKSFKDLGEKFFNEKVLYNDLTLATIRLERLRCFPIKENNDISIERGVTDYLHCYLTREKTNNLSPELIMGVVDEENRILQEKGFDEINKTLLIMKDESFIEKVILKEPHRLKTYLNLDYYLSCQEDYVKFTKKYNDIAEVIEITDAIEYLNNLNNNKHA